MSNSTTLTVRLPVETKEKPARLASYTKRKQSFLGAEAIAGYVARELAIVEAIERGRAEVRDSLFVSKEDAFRDVDAVIEAAASAIEAARAKL